MAVTTHNTVSPKLRTKKTATGIAIEIWDTQSGKCWQGFLPTANVAAFIGAISTDDNNSTYDILLTSAGALTPQATG